MKCQSCGAENPEGAKFCAGCGKEFGQVSDTANPVKDQKPRKKSGCLTIIGGIFALIVVLVIIGSFSQSPSSTTDTTQTAQQAASSQPPSKPAPSPRKPKLSIENLSSKADQFGVYVYGEVTNNTNSLLTYADFTATFYDKDGKILGTGIGNMANLPAHESKTVEIMAVGIDPSRIKNYKVDIGNTMFE